MVTLECPANFIIVNASAPASPVSKGVAEEV
jgi:hypothetical protein